MGIKNNIKIGKESVRIDIHLLFQRITLIALSRDGINTSLFEYELCSFPASLFDCNFLPRAANKSQLSSKIWDMSRNYHQNHASLKVDKYVFDGGALIHRLAWEKGSKFEIIYEEHVQFLLKYYCSCIVVFDGYHEVPTVKDAAHLRRYGNGVNCSRS